MRVKFKVFKLGFYEGFKGYVRGGSGVSYDDYDLADLYNRGANWGERFRYGHSFGGAKW